MKLYIILALVGWAAAADYIIGGDDVTQAGKWPWQGSLRYNGRHNCGISLISPTKGVTAAHCVDGYKMVNMKFLFGSNNREANSVLVDAQSIKVHEKWQEGSGAFPNDIAIVTFAKSVSGANIATVPLATKGSEHAGNSDCWITGWGYKVYGGSLPVTLQEAHINVYTNTQCKVDWGSNINDGHVCIGDKVNNRGSCNGDSGGPLVCRVNGMYELVGATSWGRTGCSTAYPAGYSRIAYFRDWIRTNAGV